MKSVMPKASWRACSRAAAETGLLIVSRRFLELGVADKVVLNPQLRAGLFQKRIHGNSGCSRLILIEVKRRHAVQRALLWIVIKITGQQNASRPCQLQIQHLVALRVPRSPFDNDGPIAEHIMVFVVNDDRFRIAKGRVGRGLGHTGGGSANMALRSACCTSHVAPVNWLAFAV